MAAERYLVGEILKQEKLIAGFDVRDLNILLALSRREKENLNQGNQGPQTALDKAVERAIRIAKKAPEEAAKKKEALNLLMGTPQEPQKAQEFQAVEESGFEGETFVENIKGSDLIDGIKEEKSLFHVTPEKKRMSHRANETSVEKRRIQKVEKISQNGLEPLPIELADFSPETDPVNFFIQKKDIILPYVREVRELSRISAAANIYHFNHSFSTFFNTYEIRARAGQIEKVVYVPFSIAYFMMSLTLSVQLCLACEILLSFLKNHRRIPEHLSHLDFGRVILSLLGEETKKMSTLTRVSAARKSIFHNDVINKRFEEEDSEDRPLARSATTEVTSNFSESPEQTLSKSLPIPEIRETSSNSSESSESSEKETLKKKKKSKSNAKENGNENEILVELQEDVSKSKEEKLENNEKKDKQNKKNKNKKGQSSDSSDSSNSSDSSESSDTLSEDEYTSKNPFELKYSTLSWKFHHYQISVKPPYVRYSDGKEEDMKAPFIFDIVTKFHKFELCKFADSS